MLSLFWGVLGFLYSTWWWSVLSLSVACAVYVVALARSDCDLLLAWYSRWVPKSQWPSIALQGKVIWITGASSGIGEYLSYHLAQCGSVLILSARREGELKRVLERCKELSPDHLKGKHMILPMDLTDVGKHSSLVQKVIKEFKKIDYLVNNAGRAQIAEAVSTELAVDRAVIDLNTFGTISLTKAVLPGMVECKEGCVVTINSVAGKIGSPGSASYSASKHALQGFFDTLRMEVVDKNISILSVCPGPVDTPIRKASFMEKLSESSPQNTIKKKRVSVERCAALIAVTMASKLDEVWISKHPILLFVYVKQYFPSLFTWVSKYEGPKRLRDMKAGLSDDDLHQ